MSDPTVRLATDADALRLGMLNREFNGPECAWMPDATQASDRGEVTLVAECDGRVVGFACLHVLHSACYAHPWAELTELYVEPAFRGRGAGVALLREAERCARDRSASELLLLTNHRNEVARRLFVRAGLVASENIVYRKSLGVPENGATV